MSEARYRKDEKAKAQILRAVEQLANAYETGGKPALRRELLKQQAAKAPSSAPPPTKK